MALLSTLLHAFLIILGLLLGLIVCLLLFILFAPIHYNIKGKKKEEINGQATIEIAKLIGVSVIFENNIPNFNLLIVGKPFSFSSNKTRPSEKSNDLPLKEKIPTPQKENASFTQSKSNKKEETTADISPLSEEAVSNNDQQILSPLSFEEISLDQPEATAPKNKSQKHLEKPKKDILGLLRQAYDDKFFSYTLRLIKKIFAALSPKHFAFDLMIGKEDPADTGELMATLMALFPLYYKYGTIRGNYTTPCLWGEVYLVGKFNVWQLIYPVISYLLQPTVRRFIIQCIK